MNRTEFMKELEYLLQDISEEEKADAIAYYQDYLEEAGDEHEAEAIREFGSPERIAAMIRAELSGSLEEGGAFTDAGYQDERFKDPGYQVVEHRMLPEVRENQEGRKEEKQEAQDDRRMFGRGRWGRNGRRFGRTENRLARVIRVIVLLALLSIAAPILLGVGGSAASIAAGIVIVAIAAVILIGLLTVAAGVGAVALLVIGFVTIFTEPWGGMLLAGCGILLLGLALIGLALSILVYGRMIPFCIRGVIDWISRLLHGGRRTRS